MFEFATRFLAMRSLSESWNCKGVGADVVNNRFKDDLVKTLTETAGHFPK